MLSSKYFTSSDVDPDPDHFGLSDPDKADTDPLITSHNSFLNHKYFELLNYEEYVIDILTNE